MIEFKCGQCGKAMEAPESLAGQPEKCPDCGLQNRVPKAMPAKQAPPADLRTDWDRRAEAWLDDPANAGKPIGLFPHERLGINGPPARQLVEKWVDLFGFPWNKLVCLQCGKQYSLGGPGGVLTVACPSCGFVRNEDSCRAVLTALENWRRLPFAANPAVSTTGGAVAAVGSEPFVVPIRCSNCGATTEAPPCQAGQEDVCPECGKKYAAADRLAAEVIAFDGPDHPSFCSRCMSVYSTIKCGVTCPHCGDAPSEETCEGVLRLRRKNLGDWRKIKRLAELLIEDATGGKTPRFICPFCKVELPAPLAERDFNRVACPACQHDGIYVYNREAFQSPDDCERVLEFRLEKRKKAEKKARERELAKAANEITTETRPDGGQANGGYVYVLINAAMQGHFKVGRTEREPEDRAKELSGGTGIPTPFAVAYAEWFKDCSAGEGYVHALLEQKGFRVAQNREFFCAPVKAAIQAIMKAKEREGQGGGSPPETGKAG